MEILTFTNTEFTHEDLTYSGKTIRLPINITGIISVEIHPILNKAVIITHDELYTIIVYDFDKREYVFERRFHNEISYFIKNNVLNYFSLVFSDSGETGKINTFHLETYKVNTLNLGYGGYIDNHDSIHPGVYIISISYNKETDKLAVLYREAYSSFVYIYNSEYGIDKEREIYHYEGDKKLFTSINLLRDYFLVTLDDIDDIIDNKKTKTCKIMSFNIHDIDREEYNFRFYNQNDRRLISQITSKKIGNVLYYINQMDRKLIRYDFSKKIERVLCELNPELTFENLFVSENLVLNGFELYFTYKQNDKVNIINVDLLNDGLITELDVNNNEVVGIVKVSDVF